MVGSAFVAAGPDAVLGDGIVGKVLIPAVIAPIVAFVVGAIAIGFFYRIVGDALPHAPTNKAAASATIAVTFMRER